MKEQDAVASTVSPAATAETHELFVRRHDGKWLVTDEQGNTLIRVRRRDRIRWIVENEKVLAAFQFPYVYLFKEACENQQWKWSASQSDPLELTVMEDAPLGEHTYAVFCLLPDGNNLQERLRSGEIGYAEGSSPTRVIIMR